MSRAAQIDAEVNRLLIVIQEKDKRIAELEAENKRLRRPACGTEQVWLDTIRHDDERALAWFRAMQRESEDKKKAMEDAERYRDLLYHVQRKFPDESRHETALRYTKNAEKQDNAPEYAAMEGE